MISLALPCSSPLIAEMGGRICEASANGERPPSSAQSQSEEREPPPGSIVSRDVRLAIDYIEAHLTTGFTIADLVAATGVPERTLFKHFKDFKGVSPMRYAHEARFLQVRRALLRAQPDESVTDIAMRSGFTHMGRFSVGYRRRF